MKQFNHVAIGGTFDHLHDGHKALISEAFKVGKNISIGITSDAYVLNKKLSNTIQPFKKRKEALQKYLEKEGYSHRASLFILDDLYGIAAKNNKLDALVVSRETLPNARKINSLRRERFMPQLKIVLVQMVKGNNNKIIRSEKIRQGEIDRHGNLFMTLLTKKPKHQLPVHLREEFRKPFGKVFKRIGPLIEFIKITTVIITVGDIITASLIKQGITPDIQIIDFKSRRKKDTSVSIPNGIKVFRVINSAGTISQTLARSIKKAISLFVKTKQTQYVVVRGEEDLTALAAILSAPLGSVVVYGHFQLGIVLVEVTEENKQKVMRLLEQFD